MIVLISGHDKYSFAWNALHYSFEKYWPDCPWPIKFITNKLVAPFGETIKVGDDHGLWGTAMSEALPGIKDNFLFLCEDYWLTAPVDTQSLKDFADHIDNKRAHYIKLNPSLDAHIDFHLDSRLATYIQDAQYRASLQISFWNRYTFGSLLSPLENIWDFETQASLRSRSMWNFLAVREFKYIHYLHPDDPDFNWKTGAVEQGHFTSAAHRWAESEGITL